ncbi:MAG: hypothetical protein AAGJ11_01115 [Bacteroidota bacterium]
MTSDAPTDRQTYRAFGLTIDSELPLAGFTSAPASGAADVRVRVAPREGHDDGDQHILARAEGTLRASVMAREVVVEPDPSADPDYIGAVVTGELFSVVLRQRGQLVLHGSCVARDGVAVGFVGESGWGKSTLAASLVARGWRLLTDDLLVVDGIDRGAPVSIPSHPSMRLSEQAIEAVDGAGRERGQAHALTSKRRVDMADAFSDEPVALGAIFVLDPRLADAHEAVPLSPREATLQFVGHTRGQRLLHAEAVRAAHLMQCARLAQATPTFHLRRRFGLDEVGALCDLVEREALRAATAA